MRQRESKKADLIFSLLAKELKTEREKQQKSIRLLAYEFDIQKSLISRLENGINEPKLISLWTLCEALNIKPSELLKRVEEDLPEDFSLIEK
ncbi:helix-turn-helix transcriptional regulator [Spirochaetes bacterium]|uniref:Helix-turn-helix transcriptional regulator n=1 Tax=Candidatus Scatousia excrementipullorum TaxID=2840936 RepID=A0A9D9GXI8_9BACT|nr:helix-turn-helix transcriptional regulator [Candidatus Scatousia excrementipullorum]